MDAGVANIVLDVVADAVLVLRCAELGAICRRHVFVAPENAACSWPMFRLVIIELCILKPNVNQLLD